MNILNRYPFYFSVLVLHLVMNRHSFKDHFLLALFWATPVFWAKASAKVLLFFELTKYFCIFFALFFHFLYKSLKINNDDKCLFSSSFCPFAKKRS